MPEPRKARISTEELSSRLDESGWVIVDVRGTAAYNGWKLRGEVRGGHIQGAVNLPTAWLAGLSESEFGVLLELKGISPDKTVVVYGAGEEDSAAVARLIRETRGGRVRRYDAGLAAWAADGNLPMGRLVNYEKLVPPEWINELVQGRHRVAYPERRFRLVEVGSGARSEYGRGHIPGAGYLHAGELEAEPLWNRVSDKDLEAALLAHGMTHDTTVVLYGRDTTVAARAAAILLYAGIQDVRLLDGGFEAWTSADYAVDSGMCTVAPVKAFGKRIPIHPEYMIDIEGVRAILADDQAELVSVRSWAEYTGNTSGYDYIEAKGRIAGAVWGHTGSDPWYMDSLRNVDNTMRSYHEIEANWRVRGITPDKKVVFYCGTGWRASEAFFCAHLMGWEKISVYDGGWHEWSSDPANPVESGEPTRLLSSVHSIAGD
jgi:3-mercaptopyruvate sulfurtransferase SseA